MVHVREIRDLVNTLNYTISFYRKECISIAITIFDILPYCHCDCNAISAPKEIKANLMRVTHLPIFNVLSPHIQCLISPYSMSHLLIFNVSSSHVQCLISPLINVLFPHVQWFISPMFNISFPHFRCPC